MHKTASLHAVPKQQTLLFRRLRLLAALPPLLLQACSLLDNPPLARPNLPAKDTWQAEHSAASAAIEKLWWTQFQDSELNELVDRALAGNPTLQVAAARITAAEALLGAAKAGWWPTLHAAAASPYTTFGQENPGGSSRISQTGWADKSSIDLNWEIDFWGKIGKGVAAQRAEYQASEADWQALRLKTAADVAQLYFFIRQIDEQIGHQQQAIERNGFILNIYRNQAQEGVVPTTVVLSQEAENKVLQQGLQELQRRRIVAENGLAGLLGLAAGSLSIQPCSTAHDKSALPTVPTALPSALLSRRPDVLAAEYRLLAAHNLTGQARLARLPTLSATANGGISNLLTAAVKVWTYGLGPAINIPIFDQNLAAQVDVKQAEQQIAAQYYRQTVLAAYEEVENTLASLASRKTQRDTLQFRQESLTVVVKKQQEQMREGLITQLEVFESQRRLLEVEQALSSLRQQILADTITLYKALGGGWSVAATREPG